MRTSVLVQLDNLDAPEREPSESIAPLGLSSRTTRETPDAERKALATRKAPLLTGRGTRSAYLDGRGRRISPHSHSGEGVRMPPAATGGDTAAPGPVFLPAVSPLAPAMRLG